jgi:transposase
VKRFVRKLHGAALPEAVGIIQTAAGEEAQVDYGSGPMVRDPQSGKYRRTRLFVLTLGYSRKSVRLLLFRSSSHVWAELHEKAFRRLGGCPRLVVLDNLREGVIVADIYDPTLNPLFRDVLAHYGVVAMPCRIKDPDRKGKVEAGVGHAQKTPLKGLRFEIWRKRKLIWIVGKNVGQIRAFTAPRNGKWRPCSPRKNPPCLLFRSNPSATTSMENASFISTAV